MVYCKVFQISYCSIENLVRLFNTSWWTVKYPLIPFLNQVFALEHCTLTSFYYILFLALSETPSRFKCNIKGKTYRYRQTFVPDTCEGFCQCSGRNRMECEPLCPTSGAECAPHQERRTQTKRVLLNPKCSCEVEECVGEEPSENHEHDSK